MTEFLQLKTLMTWPISVSAMTISLLFSWFSTVHLLPSSSVFGGFLTKLAGFFGMVGRPSLPPSAPASPAEGDATVPPARSAGFLCVISLLSTLRRPPVTLPPWFRSANTADISPAAAFAFGALGKLPGAAGAGGAPGAGGAGGPGGGGGAEGAACWVEEGAELADARYVATSLPCVTMRDESCKPPSSRTRPPCTSFRRCDSPWHSSSGPWCGVQGRICGDPREAR